jgi:hypothetical protein
MRGRTVHRETGRKETRGGRKEKRGRKKREGRKVKRGGRKEKRDGRMDKRTPCPPENRGGRRKWQEKREVYACLSIPPSLYTNVICKIWKICVAKALYHNRGGGTRGTLIHFPSIADTGRLATKLRNVLVYCFFFPVCASVMRGRQCIGRPRERRLGVGERRRGGKREGRKVKRGGRNEKRGKKQYTSTFRNFVANLPVSAILV